MGADRRHTRRRTARGTAILGSAALLAGCASMPDTGDVSAVKTSRQGDSQVRVYPVPPRENAEPAEIVEGFLEAMTGDDPHFDTARKYLTKQAARTWKPAERTTVLSTAPVPQQGGPARQERAVPGSPQTILYRLSGRKIATVDDRHAYQPLGSVTYSEFIQLVQQRSADGKQKEWRIDVLPQGLLLGESDFQRNYRSVNKYYFAAGKDWVVADPVYIRKRQDPVTGMDSLAQAVRALLEGPTNWLRPAVDTRFPDGTELKKDTTALTTDDQNTLKVPLNGRANGVGREQCRKMAAQVLFTVGDLASTRVQRVELQRPDGRPLCVLGEDRKPDFTADPTPGLRETPYFVDAQGRLAQLLPGPKETVEPRRVRGPFGDGAAKVEAVAVARDEKRAAVVSENGRTLRVAPIQSDAGLPEPLVTSRAARPADRLSAPSWDGRKDLWVADRDPAGPRLLLLPGGTGEPLTVTAPWLDEDVRVEELRLSEDGVRIAMRLTENGRTTLQIGRVERQTAGGRQKVSVVDLQAVAPRMESVTSVSWAGPSRLVVLGKQAGGVQQVRYVQTDGSASATVIPGLNQVKAVAAASDERAPLTASADDGIVRLRSGVNWQPVVDKGTSPIYPG
ncbi:LpqB family beta-propeller domain-containing protein [Streptomyces somaliensis]|uniref:LpqB family beta-propeller domain-containing protein n=1 Tax=Streptomyces somaliensis TaxID=78355 RepID=UPI0034E96D59|nr:LpqB family beta-propeller domain-containing protein [Streptomyces somaliensis]